MYSMHQYACILYSSEFAYTYLFVFCLRFVLAVGRLPRAPRAGELRHSRLELRFRRSAAPVMLEVWVIFWADSARRPKQITNNTWDSSCYVLVLAIPPLPTCFFLPNVDPHSLSHIVRILWADSVELLVQTSQGSPFRS